jgi:hypothetical protein
MRARIRLFALFSGALLAAGGALLTGSPASADVSNGPNGQRLNVSPASGLTRDGHSLSVSGSGYDETKGIYVALCIDNGAGSIPSPCAGGPTSGDSSRWVTNDPMGEGLATRYQPGGNFSFSLRVTATFKVGSTTYDCATAKCAIVTRADHTRTSDRSQDVKVALTFKVNQPDPPPAQTTKPPTKPATPATSAPASPETSATASLSASETAAATASAGASSASAVRPSTTEVATGTTANTGWYWLAVAIALVLLAGGGFWFWRRNSAQTALDGGAGGGGAPDAGAEGGQR